MRRRDRIDSGRKVAPLRAAPDAVIIDTENLNISQVLAKVLELIASDGEMETGK